MIRSVYLWADIVEIEIFENYEKEYHNDDMQNDAAYSAASVRPSVPVCDIM